MTAKSSLSDVTRVYTLSNVDLTTLVMYFII